MVVQAFLIPRRNRVLDVCGGPVQEFCLMSLETLSTLAMSCASKMKPKLQPKNNSWEKTIDNSCLSMTASCCNNNLIGSWISKNGFSHKMTDLESGQNVLSPEAIEELVKTSMLVALPTRISRIFPPIQQLFLGGVVCWNAGLIPKFPNRAG